jgi:FAD/FMN-containing dehydrogenase
MVDKRPAIIVFCAATMDVVEAVVFARSHSLLVSVRAGGHNVAGCSVCDGGIVVDLSRMKGIEVDPVRRIARAEAGLNLGEFDAATQAYGLATTMGVNSDTGIAGLTLGGGFGKLGRKHGLTCDNLVAAEVVTADGRLLRANATENADLFWGIRGAAATSGSSRLLNTGSIPSARSCTRARCCTATIGRRTPCASTKHFPALHQTS